jgi:hypothetical protein
VYVIFFKSASVLRRILCSAFVIAFVTSANGQVATGYYVTPSDVRLHVVYAQCVAKRDPVYATQVLNRFINEPYGKSIRDGFARFEGCKPGAYFVPQNLILGGALAEALLPPKLSLGNSFEILEKNLPALLNFEKSFVICAFQSAPTDIEALLNSRAGTKTDAQKMNDLIANIPDCVDKNAKRKATARDTRGVVRSLLALAAYASIQTGSSRSFNASR